MRAGRCSGGLWLFLTVPGIDLHNEPKGMCKGACMQSVRMRKLTWLLVVLALIGSANVVAAFSFSPMSASIESSGPNAVITYKVTNESDKQIAVSIKVMTRSIDPAGVESNEPADKLFLVFPARVVLKPNSSQNVKVQYKGNPAVPVELAFRVVAEQLPVDFAKATSSGVNILLTYVAALYVTPKNAEARLLVSQAVGAEQDGRKGLRVTISNEGTRHALISNPVIRLTGKDGTLLAEFGEKALEALAGQNILAKSQRIIFVPWESAQIGGTYQGTISAEIE